jgi:hypothetical protein
MHAGSHPGSAHHRRDHSQRAGLADSKMIFWRSQGDRIEAKLDSLGGSGSV